MFLSALGKGTSALTSRVAAPSNERRLRALHVSCKHHMQQQTKRAAEKAPAAPRRKQVVTAVVENPQNGNVLLVLRSDKVGTYKLHWGGISGGLEGERESCVYRCLQELSEEVALREDHLALVRSGRPLTVDDGRLHFCVHPFLFRLTDPDAQVELNWENAKWAWVPPQDIRGLQAVPLLAETYERVVVPPALQPALDRLEQDRTHGAAQLAVSVLDALREAAQVLSREGSPEEDGSRALDTLRNYGYHLACVRPAMAPLANAAAAVLSAAHSELASRADAFEIMRGEVCSSVAQAALAQREVLASAALRVQAQAQQLVKDGCTVLTTSYSSTIAEALGQAARGGRRFCAIVCESRPLCEGVSLANALAAAGVGVTVITDAQAGAFMAEADLVLVGADSLTADAVVNKVGTYLLALAAKARGVPMYALADTSKFYPGAVADLAHPGDGSLVGGHEEKAAAEVTSGWHAAARPGVAVHNVYFEPTPLELFSGVVTEEGLLEPAQVEPRIDRLRELYREAFLLD